ncbi:MAG: hypothetical protein NZM18_13430 [Thermoflexales bacterium]|nr:hypothetical protein [Thermoflexales bacterium]MDW8350953.1 hypothetical protein [Anaerolineae bacterium]
MDDLRQRTRSKLIQNAIFSPLSALIIAAAIILVGIGIPIPVLGQPPFNLSPVWWLAGLLPLWLAVIGARVASRQAGEQAVSQALREEFDLNRIRNPSLRMNVKQAIAYRERIDKAVERFTDSAMQHRMQDVANQVEEWVRNIYALASRLDAFQNDEIIHRDLSEVPKSIERLKQRALQERDEAIRRELDETISRRQAQYNNLLKLETAMDRADLQLENTLTALGTVYSQMLLLDARDVDSSKAQRLRESIAAQVNSLHDVLVSMDEMYDSSHEHISRSRTNMSSEAR